MWAIGRDSDNTIPVLKTLLQTNVDNIRINAANTYRTVTGKADEMIPLFAKGLTHPKSDVRQSAMKALVWAGEHSKGAEKELLMAMFDEQASVRENVVDALGRVRPHSHRAIPTLVVVLQDPNHLVRFRAAKGLGFKKKDQEPLLPSLRNALPALRDALNDADQNVRYQSAQRSYGISPFRVRGVLEPFRPPRSTCPVKRLTDLPRSREALRDELQKVCKDRDPEVRKVAGNLVPWTYLCDSQNVESHASVSGCWAWYFKRHQV